MTIYIMSPDFSWVLVMALGVFFIGCGIYGLRGGKLSWRGVKMSSQGGGWGYIIFGILIIAYSFSRMFSP